jgi:hypothetical protein
VVLIVHHIAADGWSLDILMGELSAHYRAVQSQLAVPVEPLPIQFMDYAAWQHNYLKGAVLEEQLNYWRRQLAGAPPQLKLPTDLPRPATQSFKGALHPFRMPPELAATVADLCRSEAVTPYIVLLTVLQVVLRHYSGQNDISVGSPIANRTQLETEALIGFFANTLVLRSVFPDDPSFRQMLVVTRETALGAYAHQHMPFERLVEVLRPARAAYNPLFQVNFRVVTKSPATLQLGSAVAERVPFDPGTARFDLALELLYTPEGLSGYFEYSTDLFGPATIRGLQVAFENVLRAAARQPQLPVSALELERLTGTHSVKRGAAIRRRTARTTGA